MLTVADASSPEVVGCELHGDGVVCNITVLVDIVVFAIDGKGNVILILSFSSDEDCLLDGEATIELLVASDLPGLLKWMAVECTLCSSSEVTFESIEKSALADAVNLEMSTLLLKKRENKQTCTCEELSIITYIHNRNLNEGKMRETRGSYVKSKRLFMNITAVFVFQTPFVFLFPFANTALNNA